MTVARCSDEDYTDPRYTEGCECATCAEGRDAVISELLLEASMLRSEIAEHRAEIDLLGGSVPQRAHHHRATRRAH